MPSPDAPTVTGIICTIAGIVTLGIAMLIGLAYLIFDKQPKQREGHPITYLAGVGPCRIDHEAALHARIRLIAGKVLIASIPTMLFGTIALVALANLVTSLLGLPSEW